MFTALEEFEGLCIYLINGLRVVRLLGFRLCSNLLVTMAVPLIKHVIVKKKKNKFLRNQSDRKVSVPVSVSSNLYLALHAL